MHVGPGWWEEPSLQRFRSSRGKGHGHGLSRKQGGQGGEGWGQSKDHRFLLHFNKTAPKRRFMAASFLRNQVREDLRMLLSASVEFQMS